MKTYTISFEITTPTDPAEWDWDNLLNLDENENYYINSIKEKAGKKWKSMNMKLSFMVTNGQ